MPYVDAEKSREARRRYARSHPEVIKRAALRCRIRTKNKAVALLGGQCVVCAEKDLRLLTINHVNGDGFVDRQKFQQQMGGTNPDGIAMYRALIAGRRDTNDLDIRCYNHNILYEYEIGRRSWIEGLV